MAIGALQDEADLQRFIQKVLDRAPVAIKGQVPVGAAVPYGGAAAPNGDWLLCDGSAVSRSTYSALFTAIGSRYGAGDGSTTFNLPDWRGRAVYGIGTHADVSGPEDNDALAVGSRTPKHAHTAPAHTHTAPAHAHTLGPASQVVVNAGAASGVWRDDGALITSSAGGSATSSDGASATTADAPPYGTANWLMRAK